MNSQFTTRHPGVAVKMACHSSYTSPALDDKVYLSGAEECNKIADDTTTSVFLGHVVAVSPDKSTVTVETPFRVSETVKSSAAISSVGLGVWVGQKVRLFVSGSDSDTLAISAHGMLICSLATGADEDVIILR